MNKDRVINELLKRISALEYEVERLEMMLEAEIEKNIKKKETSEYCDKLEKAIDEILEFLNYHLDEKVINKAFDMTTKEFTEYIKSKIISR